MKFYKITKAGHLAKFYCPFCHRYHYEGDDRSLTCNKCIGLVIPVDFSIEIYHRPEGEILGYVAPISNELFAFTTDEFLKEEYLYQLALKCKQKIYNKLKNVIINVNEIHGDVRMYVKAIELGDRSILSIRFRYEPQNKLIFTSGYDRYVDYAINFNAANLTVNRAARLLLNEIKEVLKSAGAQ